MRARVYSLQIYAILLKNLIIVGDVIIYQMHKLYIKISAAGILLPLAACAPEEKSAERPNIIFFLVDDYGWLDRGYEEGLAKYASMVESVDKSFGDVLDFVERKGSCYEGGIRVPMTVYFSVTYFKT